MGGARKLTWRNDLQGGAKLFSEPFKTRLRKEFSISEDGIRTLSQQLTSVIVLSHPLAISILPAVYEPLEGIKTANQALKQLRQAKEKLQRSLELFNALHFQEAEGFPPMDASQLIESRISDLQKGIDTLSIQIVMSVKGGRITPMLPGATDKPKQRSNKLRPHEKRPAAVDVCLNCLAREGHHIGYSTSSDIRTGPTIRFVQAVLGELTTPGSQIEAATIRSDFRRWNNKVEKMHFMERLADSIGLKDS